jgi:hypothetical protein
MDEHLQLISLLRDVLDRSTAYDWPKFALDGFMQLATGTAGVLLGYWLARRSQVRAERRDAALDALKRFYKLRMDVGASNIGRIMTMRLPLGPPGTDLHAPFLEFTDEVIENEPAVQALHLDILASVPWARSAAETWRTSWLELFGALIAMMRDEANRDVHLPRVMNAMEKYAECCDKLTECLVGAISHYVKSKSPTAS